MTAARAAGQRSQRNRIRGEEGYRGDRQQQADDISAIFGNEGLDEERNYYGGMLRRRVAGDKWKGLRCGYL